MMIGLAKFTPRMWLILAHDLLVTALAVLAAFYIRFEEAFIDQRHDILVVLLPVVVFCAGGVYLAFGLQKSKWRFTSLPEFVQILKAATVLAVGLLALDYVLLSPNLYGTFFFGKITIVLYWFLQVVFLAGPRVAYRYFRYTRTLVRARDVAAPPTLIVGRAADADVLVRSVESGAVSKIRPVGILSSSSADQGQAIRGVPVLGDYGDIERVVADLAARGTTVTRLVMTASALAPDAAPESLLMRARRLGLTTSRLPSLDEGGDALRLAPVNVEDLLVRPSVRIDYRRLENFARGKSAIVTGGGGSIGMEICDRLVTFGVARLLVLENSEPALHAVMEMLHGKLSASRIEGRIADVRDRDRIFKLTAEFKPDLVFHAAALKHVPILERDWGEGVRTNVFGSVNVADAAVAAHAEAMVMISTDKAIEPVSVLGATKRLAEMYCQALDADLAHASSSSPTRLISVRFGNVLASNGSVVPKFKAQIEAGGPVTVTHPDMVRYFMTIREACDLVITSATHALSPEAGEVGVYVLNMGQPVKIVDLAERLIRLSGLEPGRDIEVVFTGVRPGERLNEILFASEEPVTDIGMPGIVAARPAQPSLETVRGWLENLDHAIARGERGVLDWMLRGDPAASRKQAV
ncbi:MAG TPA: nucleoside-diphosphate sugar epimerase/dehydratase [Xanthobacteraceae bacterium]|nr:nucleoside-diphosphate sugar epimerase/dehydratase [Xanthobacteraceae bacterium]